MGNITCVQPAGGIISPSSMSFTAGDTITFSLSVSDGYTLTNWSVSNDGVNYYDISSTTAKQWGTYDSYQSSNGYERLQIYNVTDDIVNVTATLSGGTTETEYTLTTTSVTGATLSPSSLTFSAGDVVFISCILQDGYDFQYWVNASGTKVYNNTNTDDYYTYSSGNEYTYRIKSANSFHAGNYTVAVAAQTTYYTITASPNGAGVSLSPSNATANPDESYIVAAHIEDDYEFGYWTVNGITITNNKNGTISSASYESYSSGKYYYIKFDNIGSNLTIYATATKTVVDTPDDNTYTQLYRNRAATTLIYPITKAAAITMNDGTNLETLLTQLQKLL